MRVLLATKMRRAICMMTLSLQIVPVTMVLEATVATVLVSNCINHSYVVILAYEVGLAVVVNLR